MTAKEIRMMLSDQMKLVRDDAKNIPQAETIANLTGKTLKTFQLELQAESMRAAGKQFASIFEILGK